MRNSPDRRLMRAARRSHDPQRVGASVKGVKVTGERARARPAGSDETATAVAPSRVRSSARLIDALPCGGCCVGSRGCSITCAASILGHDLLLEEDLSALLLLIRSCSGLRVPRYKMRPALTDTLLIRP